MVSRSFQIALKIGVRQPRKMDNAKNTSVDNRLDSVINQPGIKAFNTTQHTERGD